MSIYTRVIIHFFAPFHMHRHERIEATKKSLAEYENLNNFGKREIKRLYHDDPHFFAEEMLVVKDMIEMLPSKISKMHYQGQQFTR